MNILLVKPISVTSAQRSWPIAVPDVGLGYLATALLRKGHNVVILDCEKDNMGFKAFTDYIKHTNYDIIGFKTYSMNLPTVKKSLSIIKDINSSIFTIVGGPHPSGDPYKVLEQLSQADFAFKGEGEVGLPRLIDALQDHSGESRFKKFLDIPGLIWRKEIQIVCNPQHFVEDLDSLGFPAWDLMDIDSYRKKSARLFGFYIPIITSRGCPYSCTYCAGYTITGRRIRYRSVINVIDEIEYLHKKYDILFFTIADDNFSFRKEYILNFCQEMLNRNLKIKWDCASNGIRLDTVDEEMVEIMERAGCYFVSLAFESGSERILKHMKKGFSLLDVKKRLALIKLKTKMRVNGFFILGYPEEEKEDIKKTIKFACNLNINSAQFFIFSPFPGSEIAYQLLKENRLKNIDWSSFEYDQVTITPRGISKRQLKWFQIYAYLRFYLRPNIFLDFLKEIDSLQKLKGLVRNIFSVMTKI